MKKIIPNGTGIFKKWFNRGFSHLIIYLRDNVSADINIDFICDDGFALGRWINDIRKHWKSNELTEKQKYLLESIGVSGDGNAQNWETMYCIAKNYYLTYGTLPDDITYLTHEGVVLGAWIYRQKRFGYLLREEQKEKLKVIGIGREIV